ncbi:hypothetical protein KAM380_096480 [Aeromonas caviae]|nr:hypothetical protein KAM380_096480 [Aeromonas caviae]
MSLHQQLSEGSLYTGVVSASLFVLAEASANPGLLGRLEFHSTRHQCLWHLDHHTGLEKHAPLLFQLTAGSELDAWLGGLEGPSPVLSPRPLCPSKPSRGTCAALAKSRKADVGTS